MVINTMLTMSMGSKLFTSLSRIPVPLFGNMSTAVQFGVQSAKAVPKYARWAVPGIAGGAWFIWPAAGEDIKMILGIIKDPELVAAEAEMKKKMQEEVQLDMDKVAAAGGAPPVVKISKERQQELAREAIGDYTHLHSQWDKYMDDAVYGEPEDDDDDDEDDDEDDDDEEEGEEEDEEEEDEE